MDFVFWIILIVLIVGVVWWLLNRGSSSRTTADGSRSGEAPTAPAQGVRADGALAGGSAAASAEAAGTTGIPTAAGFGRLSEPVPPTTADEAYELSEPAQPSEPTEPGRNAERESPVPAQPEPEAAPAQAEAAAPPEATPAGTTEAPAASGTGPAQGTTSASGTSRDAGTGDQAEWETQWSEAGRTPAPPAAASAAPAPAPGTLDAETDEAQPAGSTAAAPQAAPVHHPEYTEPHSPTLPGAESAAAEVGIDEPAAPEPAETGTAPEASGHLAADRPYGEGSASPAADGSGPAEYTVKGDAGSMVYYEEGHPEYEQTRAGVWFESAAHAEAAGFRPPRRNRLQ
jgi:hypothetical protein